MVTKTDLQTLSQCEIETLDTLREIQQDKRSEGISPNYATTKEIQAYIRRDPLPDLRNLYRMGIIEHHRTVNGMSMFGAVRQNSNNGT